MSDNTITDKVSSQNLADALKKKAKQRYSEIVKITNVDELRNALTAFTAEFSSSRV